MKIIITDKSGQILYEGSPLLHGNGVIIGSGNDCDIQLNKMGVARSQLQLRYNSEGHLTLQDLQSPFGTIIDGVKIQPGFVTTVKPGAFIELSEDLFMQLQIESDEKRSSISDNKLFPFFLASNESFVRRCFSQIRSKIPRQHYAAISAAEGELATRIKELSAVLEVTYALNSINSFPRMLDFTLEMALAVTGGERAMIMLFNDEMNRLETVAMQNFDPAELNDDLQATAGLVSKCFDSGESMIGPSHNFKLPGHRGKTPHEAGIMSIAIVPLMERETIIGILYVDTRHSDNILTSRAEELMKIFAAQAAVAINRTRMFHSATTDSTTGIANQNLFLRRLTEEFCRAQRHQKDISLILMDLDHFTEINENYGEHNADRVLKEVGKIFKNATRIHDLISRFGADTFAMLLPETPFSGAKSVAIKLKAALGNTKTRTDKGTIQITGSFGIASSSKSTLKPADLLKAAEKALKLAIKRGGNQIV
ncbi:MAG: diguanylate cyclase [Candidatus Riflebacteria bacterium]|nr:diguanylate cyclase [Candidatus Riflebacteria bacterium]